MIREGIMWAGKVGDTLAVNFEGYNIDFKNDWNFPDAHFDTSLVFNPKVFKEDENYKKMLLPEEDVDDQGNKGYYRLRKDYQLCLIFNYVSDDNIRAVMSAIPNADESFEVYVINNSG